jgi:hypothetical protein
MVSNANDEQVAGGPTVVHEELENVAASAVNQGEEVAAQVRILRETVAAEFVAAATQIKVQVGQDTVHARARQAARSDAATDLRLDDDMIGYRITP